MHGSYGRPVIRASQNGLPDERADRDWVHSAADLERTFGCSHHRHQRSDDRDAAPHHGVAFGRPHRYSNNPCADPLADARAVRGLSNYLLRSHVPGLESQYV